MEKSAPRRLDRPAADAVAARARAFVRQGFRKKVLGWVLLGMLALGAMAVAVVYRLHPRRSEPAAAPADSLPPNARQSAAGYSFTRSEGGHPVFAVRAKRSVDLKGGAGTILEGVEVEMFGRVGGQHDLLRTDRCDYHPQSGNFSCAGQVDIELNAPSGEARAEAPPAEASPSPTLEAHQPVYLETSGLTYSQPESKASTAAPVRWRYGPASGSAVGLTYNTKDGWLQLDRDVAASWPVEASLSPGTARVHTTMHLTATRLRYTKTPSQIELGGPIRITEAGRQVDAGHATASLDAKNRLNRARFEEGVEAWDHLPDRSLTAKAASIEAELDPETGHLKNLAASGSVQMQSERQPNSGVSRIEADRVQVSFAGAHFHPAEGTALGNVHLTAQRPADGARSRTGPAPGASSEGGLLGEIVDTGEAQFSFRLADGGLAQASTVGPGKLLLVPSTSHAGNRVITAGHFLTLFDAKSRLETVRGFAPTRIVFEQPAGAPRGAAIPESSAESLLAKLDPATGALQSLEQSGKFQLLNGDQKASADQARYSDGAQVLTLTGKPSITDPNSRIRADGFVVHLATDSAQGIGHVSSTHWGPLDSGSVASSPAKGSPVGRRPTRDSGSLGNGLTGPNIASTTNVIADRVTVDRPNQYAHYEGHVRAWHGADVIESPSLDLYRAEHRIVAGPVVTSDLAPAPVKEGASQEVIASGDALPARPAKSKVAAASGRVKTVNLPSGATEPVTIRADHLEYFELGRKAAYRGHVRMDASGATLEAERLDAYFNPAEQPGGRQLDRAVADGRVTVVAPGRRAAGDHAEYFAAQGKVVMTGGPPTLEDAENGFTTGQTLTFLIQGGSLTVDGGKGFRALSKHPISQ